MYRGSRKHVLDWTDQPAFLGELFGLMPEIPLKMDEDVQWMPRGYASPDEARLETFGRACLPANPAWPTLAGWWLAHQGGNTPNWDIAVGCRIDERPGLLLVEAKANWAELSTAGKQLKPNASRKSWENHKRIGAAIGEACDAWQQIHPRVTIARDSHYQLANRLAWTWRLVTLGIPVVLLYLGFTGDEGIRDVGEPFPDDASWQRAFAEYSNPSIPMELVGNRLRLDQPPAWIVSRSRPVLSISPSSGSK